MFRRLRTKLTVLYAALLGAGLLLVSVAVHTVLSTAAERLVQDELESSATVFERVWTLRSHELQDTADVLSRDFGFREAVASDDAATIRSALSNLSGRLNLDLAMIVGVDGRITTVDGKPLGEAGADILRGLDEERGPGGLLMIAGAPYHVVSAPMLSPILTGWVVFGVKLDGAEMRSLEQLSAIPLDAVILTRRSTGGWRAASGRMSPEETPAAAVFVDRSLSGQGAPRELAGASGAAIAVVKPLKAVNPEARFALLLRYPIARAMSPYRPVTDAVVVTALLGGLLLLAGSWALARNVTEPISQLDEAARRLREGEDATVPVASSDEIGRLADSFNHMAAAIRERERRLASALNRAESANRLTSEFLANMSHEIRTPLNGVLGLTQVMARTATDPAQRELTAAVIESASALERLLCDILEAAQLQAGAAELHPEPFCLAAALQAAAAPWRAAAQEKGLAFGLDLAPEVDSTVIGDAARLAQVLNALLGNAVKFTREGRIDLSARPIEGGFRFEVSDTGPGVAPELKAQLFAAFRQADGSSTRKHGGVGLGLSVAHGFVALMEGRLDCDARPEGGAVFWLELPLPGAPARRAVA